MTEERKTRFCAIYTRKSVDDGLDQEFNTLDAQREAGENYIASQRDNGWTLLPKRYDDGGYSGANTNRPALKALLADCEAGVVDVVVVYKIDRLSRSIRDFAELSAKFDRWGVSFCSVTQDINTATSSGRMVLNILMTFAQFEREIISERIRDKMAAMRRRGIWVGGIPPFGYKVVERRLVPCTEEKPVVERIFTEFAVEGRMVRQIVAGLNGDGKLARGGVLWRRKRIMDMLANCAYIGCRRQRGEVIQSTHEALVPRKIWDDAQALLVEEALRRKKAAAEMKIPLEGLVFCGHCGRRMTASVRQKWRGRFIYYVCTGENGGKCPVREIPSRQLEKFVWRVLGKALRDEKVSLMYSAICNKGIGPFIEWFDSLSLTGSPFKERHGMFSRFIEKVTVTSQQMELEIKADSLREPPCRPSGAERGGQPAISAVTR